MLPIRELDHLWWFMSHHSILWWTIPHPHPRDRILLVMFPLRRHTATARWLTSSTCKESRTWFGHLVVGVRGGGHPSSGGAPAPVAARPTPPSRPAGGPSFGLSPHKYISYGGPPTAQLGGGSRGCNGIGACFCFPSENSITYGGS